MAMRTIVSKAVRTGIDISSTSRAMLILEVMRISQRPFTSLNASPRHWCPRLLCHLCFYVYNTALLEHHTTPVQRCDSKYLVGGRP